MLCALKCFANACGEAIIVYLTLNAVQPITMFLMLLGECDDQTVPVTVRIATPGVVVITPVVVSWV